MFASLAMFSETHSAPLPEVTPEALEALVAYAWPGNVRELRNIAERLVLRSRDGRVDVPALPDVMSTVNLGDFVQPFDMASLLPRTNVDGLKGLTTIPVGARRGGAGGTESGLSGSIFSLADLDRAPTATFQPAPQVPPNLRNRAAGVLVVVEFIVTTKGTVTGAVVIKSDNTEFDDTALRTVRQWKFRPGYKRGKTVNSRIQQPIRFTVNDGE